MTDGVAGSGRSRCSSRRGSRWAQDGPQQLPQIRLNAGIHNINAELAPTPEQREIGLMFRPAMAANDGMLFVFERAGQQCFWMKNTLIPLSVAFIADDGSVVNLDDMKPQTRDGHCSSQAGALRARDERGLVRQARHQARQQAARRAVRATRARPRRRRTRGSPAPARCSTRLSRSSWRRSPSWRASVRKVSTHFGRRLR